MAGWTRNTATLDAIRSQYGNQNVKNEFYNSYRRNPNSTIDALNDYRLAYPTLYVLYPEVIKLDAGNQLSGRNKTAANISRDFIFHRDRGSYQYKPEHYPVLLWMLQTGYYDYDLGDEYDQIMDYTGLLLLKQEHDKSCLQPMEEMIFGRNRRGLNTCDAEWAFLGCEDPECLKLLANRLLSKDRQDVELACKMLSFIPCFDSQQARQTDLYTCVMQWINENKPYLQYTGESSQECNSPYPYKVSNVYKYLQKPITFNDISRLSSEEKFYITRFIALDEDKQAQLSGFSQKLHSSDRMRWGKWMSSPLDIQIGSATRRTDV